ncbi:MAG: chloride channel protein [Phycisphaerales bacterium]|nr:chloride channel protein [Phycisphaerales bacterium]
MEEGKAARKIEQSSTTGGLPVSPSLGPTLEAAEVPHEGTAFGPRAVYVSIAAMVVGLAAALASRALIYLIWFLTNLFFYHRFSVEIIHQPMEIVSPVVIGVPVIGAIIIGLMARYGSRAVAGHGIPEAMEQVLLNQSNIPAKMTFLKPVSAAISIGTGGPYGAEGPIIATGGALGSLLGQFLPVTTGERKTLLAAGAAAGIATAFGAPVASVLLAIELLLFEFRPRSIIPVALACVVATVVHYVFEGEGPFFHFAPSELDPVTRAAMMAYLVIGCIIGVGAVVLTRTVYLIEHLFEKIPIHWMWHPAIGAVLVGVIGYLAPRTFGSGYFNIDDLLSQKLALGAIVFLGIMKFLSWTISLGSGTAGGTLAPVFTIGGTLGAILGIAGRHLFPQAHIDISMAALVGMVGIFAGASRALLTSVVFAVETTMAPMTILPALAGCSAAYLVSCLLMRHSIMTEKMARQGVHVPEEFEADFLDTVSVSQMMSRPIVSLLENRPVGEVRDWIQSGAQGSSHQGFPVVDANGYLLGVLTRRDLLKMEVPGQVPVKDLLRRRPSVVYDDCTLRDAADHMVNHDVGRLPVVSRQEPSKLVGMITRSDVLRAHRMRLREEQPKRHITFKLGKRNGQVIAAGHSSEQSG